MCGATHVDVDAERQGRSCDCAFFAKRAEPTRGEATLSSAEMIRTPEGDRARDMRIGMNVPGNDNRQFALNVLHWLSGLLS